MALIFFNKNGQLSREIIKVNLFVDYTYQPSVIEPVAKNIDTAMANGYGYQTRDPIESVDHCSEILATPTFYGLSAEGGWPIFNRSS